MANNLNQHYLIVMVCKWWNAEAHYAFNLAKALTKDNRVTILSKPNQPFYKKAKQQGFNSLDKVELDTINPINIISNYIRCKRFIKDQKVDVVVTFKSQGTFMFSFLNLIKVLPSYIKIRSNPIPPKNNILNKLLYSRKSCNLLIAVNNQIKDWFVQHWNISQPIPVLYFGTEELITTVDRAGARKNYNIEQTDVLITLVGRIDEVKGHTLFLEAINKYLTVETSPKIKVLFAVKDPNECPEHLKKVEKLIEKNRLSGIVQIFGWVDNLGDLMKASDYIVVPSLGSEAICRVAMESFSVGTPVIANPVGALKEVIQHKKDGYVCSIIHKDEMVKALIWAQQNHNNTSLRNRARESFLNCYSMVKLRENFDRILEERHINS